MEVKQMVVAAGRIVSDVNGLSLAIHDVNCRQSHFESVLRTGWMRAGPKVECDGLRAKPMAIAIYMRMSDAGSKTCRHTWQ